MQHKLCNHDVRSWNKLNSFVAFSLVPRHSRSEKNHLVSTVCACVMWCHEAVYHLFMGCHEAVHVYHLLMVMWCECTVMLNFLFQFLVQRLLLSLTLTGHIFLCANYLSRNNLWCTSIRRRMFFCMIPTRLTTRLLTALLFYYWKEKLLNSQTLLLGANSINE